MPPISSNVAFQTYRATALPTVFNPAERDRAGDHVVQRVVQLPDGTAGPGDLDPPSAVLQTTGITQAHRLVPRTSKARACNSGRPSSATRASVLVAASMARCHHHSPPRSCARARARARARKPLCATKASNRTTESGTLRGELVDPRARSLVECNWSRPVPHRSGSAAAQPAPPTPAARCCAAGRRLGEDSSPVLSADNRAKPYRYMTSGRSVSWSPLVRGPRPGSGRPAGKRRGARPLTGVAQRGAGGGQVRDVAAGRLRIPDGLEVGRATSSAWSSARPSEAIHWRRADAVRPVRPGASGRTWRRGRGRAGRCTRPRPRHSSAAHGGSTHAARADAGSPRRLAPRGWPHARHGTEPECRADHRRVLQQPFRGRFQAAPAGRR